MKNITDIRVLVIATSPKTRGGITSVVSAHTKGKQWEKYHCYWLSTHRDGNAFIKLCYLMRSLIGGLFFIPFFDIIHIHLSEPLSALRKLPFMWWAIIWRKKTIIHFHSFSTKTTLLSKWAWVYRYHFSKTDRLITLSKYWKNECEKFIGNGTKVMVVYNPCPSININRKLEVDSDTKIILYAGAITPRKGYEDLIEAFAKIANKYEDWSVVFAGNGEIDKGLGLAEKLGISRQIRFLGWCCGDKKDSVFRSSTLFCLPSYAEGFPMAVLDAWAYGLPVITTPVGGIPDIAKDGDNLLLFKPGDINKLALCLELLIQDESLREKLSKESMKLASTTFNINTINNQIANLYEEMISIKK